MKKIKYLASAILISSIGFGCGTDDGSKEKNVNETSTEQTTNSETTDQVTKGEQEEVEITIVATGNTMTEIRFEPASMTVKAGSKVIVTLVNESEAAGMHHNFILVPQGAGEEVARAALTAAESNYVPEDDRIIVASEMTEMGEEVTFEFTAPEKGSYHYICTYPGHYPAMVGRLTVN